MTFASRATGARRTAVGDRRVRVGRGDELNNPLQSVIGTLELIREIRRPNGIRTDIERALSQARAPDGSSATC
jgi:hypothetical protein